MAEWSKAHAWKACVPQGTQGSNPCLSAITQKGFSVSETGKPFLLNSRTCWLPNRGSCYSIMGRVVIFLLTKHIVWYILLMRQLNIALAQIRSCRALAQICLLPWHRRSKYEHAYGSTLLTMSDFFLLIFNCRSNRKRNEK